MEEIIINPISETIKESVNKSVKGIYFAVPFLTNFTKGIFSKEKLNLIQDKKCIVRFDETNLLSFDIPTLQYLLDIGFEIRFDNNIHLKLYITDSETYVSSSNLTKGGFENNTELTVKIDDLNAQKCFEVFKQIWDKNSGNNIDSEILENNIDKYNVLIKKSKKIYTKINIEKEIKEVVLDITIDNIITEIFTRDKDLSLTTGLAFQANNLKSIKLSQLKNGYNSDLFYLPIGHENRKATLFYDIIYGFESKLAGTGLLEKHCKSVFENQIFKQIIEYIYPEIVGLKKWNLDNEDEHLDFCYGLFDFEIPNYTETLPIRLASYFYPKHFMPIFKFAHLKDICKNFGFNSNPKEKGQKLFEYNRFIFLRLDALPYDTYVKSYILYLIHYTIELYRRLQNGENQENIIDSYNKKWERNLIKEGVEILLKIRAFG